MKRFFNLIGYIIVIALVATTFSLFLYDGEEPFVIPDGTKFIAHRGLSSQHYQNSEEAFVGAAESDYFFAIETDVWLTLDDVWVCCHDVNPFVDLSIQINDVTYDQAKVLPLKDSESDVFICTFERYLQICVAGNKMPVIELKQVFSYDQIESLLQFIESIIPLERVMFISFITENVNDLLDLDSSLRVQTLTSSILTTALLLSNGSDIGINKKILTKSIVSEAKKDGAIINVWTVNDKESVDLYKSWGVDYITTDFIF